MKPRNNTLNSIFKQYPIENDILTFEIPVNFIIDAEKKVSGIIFKTSFRFGYIFDSSNDDNFFIDYTKMLRNFNSYHENDICKVQLNFINPANPKDVNADYIFNLEVTDISYFEDLDALFNEIYSFRYVNPIDSIVPNLKESMKMIERCKYDEALEILNKSRNLDPISGTIDLMIARTLDFSGKREKAATYLAKQMNRTLYVSPHIVVLEFFRYEWHKGTLLHFPPLHEIQSSKDYPVSQKNLYLAINAKINKELKNYVSYLSKFCLNTYENINTFNMQVFSFLVIDLFPFLNDETYPDIKKICEFLLGLFEKSSQNLSEKEKSDSAFIKEILTLLMKPIDQLNYDELIDTIFSFSFSNKNDPAYLLHKEKYETILTLKENLNIKNDLPESMDLFSIFYIRNVWANSSNIDNLKLKFAKIFSHLRLNNKDLNLLHREILSLKQTPFFQNIDLENSDYIWMTYISEMEIMIKLNHSPEKVLKTLYEGQKKLKMYWDTFSHPLFKFSDEIADFFQAWAFGSPSLIEEAINKIPNEMSLSWLHKLGQEAIDSVKGKYLPISNSKQALENINKIIKDMSVIASGKNLDPSTRIKIKNNKENIFNKLKEKEIRIAVGGETSAGKTTFLNSLFRTNMFFVTQEEATGVPTEIRKSNKLKIEVVDKNSIVKEYLNADDTWFDLSNNLLKDEYINNIKDFVSKYTRLGESSLQWVSKVRVYLPVKDFPDNLVLIDTPGFNAHEERSAIAKNVISGSHACIFLIDARNALKSKEMQVLKSTRDEVGKTFLVLNKMDLVLGDDDLDCDGSESADLIIERVDENIKKYFNLTHVNIYPICSISKENAPPDAHKYVENLNTFRTSFVNETLDKKLNLLLDSSAKEAIITSNLIFNLINQKVAEFQEEEIKLEDSIPKDISSYEEFILDTISESYDAYTDDYFKIMGENISSQVNATAEYFNSWLVSITNQDTIKNGAQAKAEALIKSMINTIDKLRKDELDKLTKKLSNDLIKIFKGIYSQLPFNTTFDSNKISSSINELNNSVNYSLSQQMQSVDYGKGTAIKGGLAFAAVGALFGGPLGASVGGWIGAKLFSKPIQDIKNEVYNVFCNNLNPLYQDILKSCDDDFSEERSNSFLKKLRDAINEQIESFRNTVWLKIKQEQNNFNLQRKTLSELRQNAIEIRENAILLDKWRNEKKKDFDSQSKEQFMNEIRESFGISGSVDSLDSLIGIVVSKDGSQCKTISEAIKKSKPGGRIIVKEGIYDEKIEIDKDIEIAGDGDCSKIIIKNINTPCVVINNSSVLLEGISLHGIASSLNKGKSYSTLTIRSGNLRIEKCKISMEIISSGEVNDSSCISILNENGKNHIKDSEITGSSGNGINIKNNLNTIIEDCKIQKVNGKGIFIDNSAKLQMKNCEFVKNVIGLEIQSFSDNFATDTKFINNKTAINLGSASKCLFTQCLIEANEVLGVKASGNQRFIKCEFKGNLNKQILVTDNCDLSLKECNIHTGKNIALYVENDSSCKIEHSKIHNNVEGIMIEDGSRVSFVPFEGITDKVVNFKKAGMFSKITSKFFKAKV